MPLQYRVAIGAPPPPPSCSAAHESPVKYHFTCRKGFVNQKNLEILRRQVEDCGEAGQNQPSCEGSLATRRDRLLIRQCFQRSAEEFRADKIVKESALFHIKCHTKMSCIVTEISGICAKDLISREAKYRTTCYNGFVRIMHENDKATESSTETFTNNHGIDEAYEAVYAFCETVISNPRVIEFKEIRKVLADAAERLGVAVTQSQYKNLLRMVSDKFKELEFINYQRNKVMVYPSNLEIESLMIDNFELQSVLNRANQTSLGGDSKPVMNAEKVLNEKIKNHSVETP